MSWHTEGRMERLGIVLPAVSRPAANYSNAIHTQGLLFVSGKGPAGRPSGKLGLDYSTEDGYEFARSAGLAILAVVRDELGDLDRVTQVVKLQGFVNAVESFTEHHLVLNGCSDLMAEVFEERGTSIRSVFGASSLRDHLPLIVDSIFQYRL